MSMVSSHFHYRTLFILAPVGDDDRLLEKFVGKQRILRHSRESGNPEVSGKTGFPLSRE
jgi:hypothetical protein